jgi:hypothetical protein
LPDLNQENRRLRAAAKPEVTSEFADFQKKVEYEHIAEAHFKTIEAISFFFRYYLLVMSLPVSIAGLTLLRRGADRSDYQTGLPCDGAALALSGPQLRLCRTTFAFHRAFQKNEHGRPLEVRPLGLGSGEQQF